MCDGYDTRIPGMMEHVERAGIHSGDSMYLRGEGHGYRIRRLAVGIAKIKDRRLRNE